MELYDKIKELLSASGVARVVNPIMASKNSGQIVGAICELNISFSEKKLSLDTLSVLMFVKGLPCWVDIVDTTSKTFFIMYNDTIVN